MQIVGGRAAAAVEVADVVVVRTAGLSTRVLRALRDDDLAECLTRLRLDEDALLRDGQLLADTVGTTIGLRPVDARRHDLVELRRRLHQGRRPADRLVTAQLLGLLEPALGNRVTRWVEAARQLEHDRRELGPLLNKVGARCVDDLREELRAPGFRRALALAGPTLLDELDKWHADPSRRPKPAKVLRLARYAGRAAAKTSPYSSFMSTGVASWSTTSAAPAATTVGEHTTPLPPLLELDGEVLARLHAVLRSTTPWSEQVVVRVNPSLTSVDGHLHCLGSGAGEPLTRVPDGPAMQACLEHARSVPELTVATVVERLQADVPPEQAPRVAALVTDLARAGVLDLRIPVPDTSTDRVGDLAGWAAAADGDPRVAAGLRSLAEQLGLPLPVHDVAAQRARLRRVSSVLAELESVLGAGLTDGVDAIVHEVVVTTQVTTRCEWDALRPALADLDVCRRWLALFDAKLPLRLALDSWFLQRWGERARVPLLVLIRAVRSLASTSQPERSALSAEEHDLCVLLGSSSLSWQSDLSGLRGSRLRDLDRLRAQARDLVWDRPARAGQIHVDADELRRALGSWPVWVTGPQSVACYVQVVEGAGAGAPQLVLNVIHGGHGRGRSRLSHQLRRAGAEPASPTTEPAPPGGAVRAELGGLLGSTLNVRDPTAPFEIDYPGAVGGRPAEQRLPLADLGCERDGTTQLLGLRSLRLDRRVVPLHLGMAADVRLPPAASFLERAFGSAYLVHPSAPPLVSGVGPGREGHDGIVSFPRVVVGGVVLQRARWFVRVEQLPTRAPGGDDAGYLLALARWRVDAGLPERVFFRAWSAAPDQARSKSRKPLYLDFHSPLLVSDLERTAARSSFVLFDEALPDPLGLAGGSVTELVVELGDTKPEPGHQPWEPQR